MLSDLTPTVSATVVGRPDRIIVDGLRVDTFIGVHDVERAERQQVRFDVEAETVDGYADIVRATGSFVSYADIVDFIERKAASGGHIDLVETWADEVASFVLENQLAVAVKVTVTKPDIFEHADGVGITIERWRSAGPA